MKKLTLIIALFASTHITAQLNYHASAGFDIANTLWGGTVNDRAANFHLELGLRTKVENVEVYLGYENFQILNYEAYLMGYNKVIPFKKFEFVAGFDHGVIHRWKGRYYKDDDSDSFTYTYALDAEIRYVLNERWSIGVKHNFRSRTDIGKWVGSNEFKLIYKFQKKKKKEDEKL